MKLTDLTKEQLIEEVKKLKSRKKYGLVWEDKPEDVVVQCKEKLPVLEEEVDKAIVSDKSLPTNLIIEGDNYHALSVLNYTHQGKIDAIYADPPYNTGAKDWKYNNDYVDSNDTYRHSKWIAFMDKRLRLARNLLTENGVICVTIDDYEIPRLLFLMEEIFGEFNHLGTIAIRNNPAGRSTTKGVSITHEYAIFFGKSTSSQVCRLERNQKQKDRYDEKDEKGFFEWVNFRKPGSMRIESPVMFYPIFISKDSIRIPDMEWDSVNKEWNLKEQPKENEEIIYPIDENGEERRWRYGIKRAKDEVNQFKVKKQRGKLHAYIKGRLNNKGILPMTWWDKKEYSSTAYGTNLLKDIFSELQVFSYPKSVYAVMDCLKVMTDKKDAIFLDFFAGSGTTGHAVLKLNEEDGGKRSFILSTNNENNICEKITYKRIERVINGYKDRKSKKVEGLNGNVKYYKTSFVSKSAVSDDTRNSLVIKSAEMICVRENTFEKVLDKKGFKIYENGNQSTGILLDLDDIEVFKSELRKLEIPAHIYVFSLTGDTYKNDFEDLEVEYELCPIPESILEVYRKLYRE